MNGLVWNGERGGCQAGGCGGFGWGHTSVCVGGGTRGVKLGKRVSVEFAWAKPAEGRERNPGLRMRLDLSRMDYVRVMFWTCNIILIFLNLHLLFHCFPLLSFLSLFIFIFFFCVLRFASNSFLFPILSLYVPSPPSSLVLFVPVHFYHQFLSYFSPFSLSFPLYYFLNPFSSPKHPFPYPVFPHLVFSFPKHFFPHYRSSFPTTTFSRPLHPRLPQLLFFFPFFLPPSFLPNYSVPHPAACQKKKEGVANNRI